MRECTKSETQIVVSLKIIHFDRLKPFPSSTDISDVKQTDENTRTTLLMPLPVIGYLSHHLFPHRMD